MTGPGDEIGVLQAILAGTTGERGERFFLQLVRNLAAVVRMRGVWVTEYQPDRRRLRALAFWFDGEAINDYEYDLAGTPCESVIENGSLVHIPERVVELYPDDADLRADGAVSYLGVPLLAPDQHVIGHLAALDTNPMPEDPRVLALFRIFAEQAAAELRRQQTEARLRERDEALRSLLSETEYLRRELEALQGPGEIVGTSDALKRALLDVDQVAATDATVLILGETGTGKELIARRIHDGSGRRQSPFVRVNCGALPDTLIESELFGHEKGAFTGATQRRDGRFALADGGTIFLDEIGDLPLPLQVKFLRVLQEGEFEPVGSSRTRKVDVRVIAATNRDLAEAVQRGAFRGDLYFRLNVFPITVPPLRLRGDDVVILAQTFAQRCAARLGRPIEPLSASALEALRRYAWPGNVRELENVMERGVITARNGHVDLSPILPASAPISSAVAGPGPSRSPERILTCAELDELERANILRALQAASWRVSGDGGAADLMQISPSTLSSRIKALGIKRPTQQ